MALGELIKTYCDEHGLSMQQFADMCNVSKAYISMLIRGRNPSTGKPVSPTVETMTNIATALGMSLYELLKVTQQDVPTVFHAVPPKESDKFKGLADAIVDKLKQTGDSELLGTMLSQNEHRLLLAFRAADPIYQDIALELLEGHKAKENLA